MAEPRREDWAQRRWRIAGLALLVLVVEAIGIAWGVPAVAMNLVRIGEVWLAGQWGIGGPDAFRRWAVVLLALAALEVVLLVAGAYVGLVWTIRLFVYPMAILFTTPRGGEIRFAWVWASTVGVMVVAFLMQKALASGSPGWIWASRGLAAAVAGVAVLFVDRVWKGLTSLKFATVCLTLVTVLCIVGTLIVQRPPIDPRQYPEKFAAGQVGFLVNTEVLLGLEDVPTTDQLDARVADLVGRYDHAFGDQVASKVRKGFRKQLKTEYLEEETNRLVKEHAADVVELREFLDGVFFTRMFKSWAFNALLVLLGFSLLLVVVRKWPWGRYGWGPVVSHIGIVMVLVGVTISDIWLQKGFVQMSPEGPASVVSGFRDTRGSFEGRFDSKDLDATLKRVRERLGASGDIVFRSGRQQVVLALRGGKEQWSLYRTGQPRVAGAAARAALAGIESGTWEATPWVPLPFVLQMTEGYVDYYRELMVTAPKLAGHGERAVQEGYPLLEGKEIRLFDGKYVAKILTVYPHARVPTGERVVVLTLPGAGPDARREVPAKTGAKATIPGPTGPYEVEVLEFARDFAQSQQNVPLEKQSDSNPAAKVHVKGPTGDEETVWVFEDFPDLYARGAMGKRNERVGLRDLRLASARGERGELTDSDLTAVPVEPGEIPSPDLQTAVKVSLTGPDASGEETTVTRWLLLSGGEIVGGDGEVVLRLVQTGQQSIYETHVRMLTAKGEPVREEVIRVNEPFVHGGYRFFQSTYDESRGVPVSGLTVKYDVGIPLIYAGFLVSMIGIVFAFYVLPPLRRRAEARKKEKFGSEIRKGMGF